LAKRHERLDKDIDPAIPHRRADRRIPNAGADPNRCGYTREYDVITAYLVGDVQLLERLRALPDAINSGLLRGITQLGIELQRHVQQDKLSGQVLRSRTGSLRSSIGLRVDQSGGAVTASVFTDSRYAGAQEYGFTGTISVRASLRRIRDAFGRPIAGKTISVRAYDRRIDLPERSFLRSALEDMAPVIRDEVGAALAEAVSQ
ncbi:MAG TPA: HK97 gp10 family phage protein, partial [Steroidobacteraceae bacterium]|nr:HK97 gp10 family phage protein [Steroidobacteraceae bacterium]